MFGFKSIEVGVPFSMDWSHLWCIFSFQVLEQHLVCASLEHPLSMLHDEKYFGPGLESAILTLKTKGYLSTDLSRDFSARIWSYIGHEVIYL